MWKNYTIWTDLIRKMRAVNPGGDETWVRKQEAQPALMAYLEKNNVNPRDYTAVRNFYTARRNEVSQKILYTIKATEQRVEKQLQSRGLLPPGKEFRIKDTNPNEEGPFGP